MKTEPRPEATPLLRFGGAIAQRIQEMAQLPEDVQGMRMYDLRAWLYDACTKMITEDAEAPCYWCDRPVHLGPCDPEGKSQFWPPEEYPYEIPDRGYKP